MESLLKTKLSANPEKIIYISFQNENDERDVNLEIFTRPKLDNNGYIKDIKKTNILFSKKFINTLQDDIRKETNQIYYNLKKDFGDNLCGKSIRFRNGEIDRGFVQILFLIDSVEEIEAIGINFLRDGQMSVRSHISNKIRKVPSIFNFEPCQFPYLMKNPVFGDQAIKALARRLSLAEKQQQESACILDIFNTYFSDDDMLLLQCSDGYYITGGDE